MPVKAVVFDLDGTIASFNLDYMTVRSDARGYLIKQGLPASVLSSNESIFDMLKKTEIFLKNSGKSDRAVNKIRNEVLAMAEGYELEAAKTTGLLPGVVETLETLKKMGLKLGLCTINSEKSANYILKRFGITKFFEAVVPRNRVKYVKPNIEHLEATLKALKVSAEDTLLIGDGTRDMQCARELRVIAVGLPTGVSSQKELMASGADYLVTSVTDLPILVESIQQNQRNYRKTSVRESAVTGI
jgi:HAD superfamily hydrolase (TIGR01549 family)